MALGKKGKTALAVLIPEVTIAPAVALGAVYCASTLTPNFLKRMEGTISRHIVQPHLEWFESRGGSLRKAHEDYDAKKRDALLASGQSVPEKNRPALSRQERADVIADVLTKGMIAMVSDLGATLVGQWGMSKWLKLDKPIGKRIAFFEHAAHLVGIAVMSGPLAARGEDEHYWIKHKLETLGMNRDRADDVGTTYPYIVQPGQIAAIGSLCYALFRNGKQRA